MAQVVENLPSICKASVQIPVSPKNMDSLNTLIKSKRLIIEAKNQNSTLNRHKYIKSKQKRFIIPILIKRKLK
jgi:hypothetical protein